jgi:hypothetical protein
MVYGHISLTQNILFNVNYNLYGYFTTTSGMICATSSINYTKILPKLYSFVKWQKQMYICVCMCVCKKERERETAAKLFFKYFHFILICKYKYFMVYSLPWEHRISLRNYQLCYIFLYVSYIPNVYLSLLWATVSVWDWVPASKTFSLVVLDRRPTLSTMIW